MKVLNYEYALIGKSDYDEVCIALTLTLKEQVWRPRSAFTNSVASDKLLNFFKPVSLCEN